MKVAIVGSRDYPDMEQVVDFVFQLPDGTEVVSGGARGVDSWAADTAKSTLLDLEVRVFPADWNRHGKSAGYIRNQQIVDYADCVVAFWDGKSRGTAHTIKLAREADKLKAVFGPDDLALWDA